MRSFVLLDSWRSIPQRAQHLVVRSYADINGLDIEFYGDELYGYEHNHSILIDYLENGLYEAYLFFSIHQFRKSRKSNVISFEQIDFLHSNYEIPFFFALEGIAIKNRKDLANVRLDIFAYNIIVENDSIVIPGI